jgi:excisionase family DNA binding protein
MAKLDRIHDRDLLTPAEAAERLSIGRTKVYELMNAGELQFIKIGRSCRIVRASINAMIARKVQEQHNA